MEHDLSPDLIQNVLLSGIRAVYNNYEYSILLMKYTPLNFRKMIAKLESEEIMILLPS
jgi:hypothetical protein